MRDDKKRIGNWIGEKTATSCRYIALLNSKLTHATGESIRAYSVWIIIIYDDDDVDENRNE